MPDALKNHRDRVRTQLEEARARLSNPIDDALTTYQDFLDHNELGLALDALADVAREQRSPARAWHALGEAAESMGLDPDHSVHGRTVEEILGHLSATDDWRGLQRHLNAWDPVGVLPELGGPDEEYSCLYVPLMNRLCSGSTSPEIAALLRGELSEHFGIDPVYSRPDEFARRLVEWYAAGASA